VRLVLTCPGAVDDMEAIMHGGCENVLSVERVPLDSPNPATQCCGRYCLKHLSLVKHAQVFIVTERKNNNLCLKIFFLYLFGFEAVDM
jgi:hypothetical protein